MQCMLFVKILLKQKQVRNLEVLPRQKLEIPQESYISHDIVYYKQSDSYQWKGPGAVSEHENKHISETQWGLCKSPCMLFTACSKLKMTSKKENIESEDSGNVENKNEPLDI